MTKKSALTLPLLVTSEFSFLLGTCSTSTTGKCLIMWAVQQVTEFLTYASRCLHSFK